MKQSKSEEEKPKLVVKLKKVGDNKYDFAARNSVKTSSQSGRHELDGVATGNT